MPVIQVQPPFTVAECSIVQDEDWLDPLPRILEGDQPLDLTGKKIEIFIRPVYDHNVLIKKLSTEDASIRIDDATAGLASIRVTREVVAATIPIGVWDHFCVLTEAYLNSSTGVLRRELFRGPLTVRPGRVAG